LGKAMQCTLQGQRCSTAAYAKNNLLTHNE
jgi:hypothetical protein